MDYIIKVRPNEVIIPTNLPIGVYRLVNITSTNNDKTSLTQLLAGASGNSYKIFNALLKNGYHYLEELDGKTDTELLKLRYIGISLLVELIIFCKQHNITIQVHRKDIAEKLKTKEL